MKIPPLRRCGGPRRLVTSSVLRKNKFFLENSEINDESSGFLHDFLDSLDHQQIDLKRWLEAKPQIPTPWKSYISEKLQTFPSPIARFLDIPSIPPMSSYQEIVRVSESNSPCVGSFVEFIDPLTNNMKFGVVLRPVQSKFNENYNKVIVLDTKNELCMVSPTNIQFHLYGVVDESFVESLQILQNRFDEQFKSRLLVVDILKQFIDKCCNMSETLMPQLDMIYSQRCQTHTITSISAVEIIESIQFPESMLDEVNQSYFHQCQLLTSIHFSVLKLPTWMSTGLISENTNIIRNGCSNEIPSNCIYFINSSSNHFAINKLISDFKNKSLMNATNQFMNQLLAQQRSSAPKSFEELTNFFNIWEGRHFKHIIDVIKFCIIYPHSEIMNSLKKLDVFKDTKHLTSTDLFVLLENLRIYNNAKCSTTDIYLSANIAGEPSLSQIAVSSTKEISSSISSTFLQSNKLVDKFHHLRKSKPYYQDHVVYGLPYLSNLNDDNKNLTFLAISLEKVSARRYTINVHIPDVMTKLSPSSTLFEAILSKNFKALTKLVNNMSINNLFEEKFLEEVGFKQQTETQAEWIKVGDVSMDRFTNSFHSNLTCLTLSFTYDVYESNPFSKLADKVYFSFDSLGSVKIKNVNWKELDECLEGKTESSPFRLFRSSSHLTGKSPTLSDIDCHNIRFIYNVMKSHFKIRNNNGASLLKQNIDPNDSSKLIKEVSYVNENTTKEKVITKLNTENDVFSKSKFFINELDMFMGNSTSLYCSKHEIPVYHRNQSLLPYDSSDPVLVTHSNMLLPSYHADSYKQTLIARDQNGYVSIPASVIGKSYLAVPTIEVYGNINVQQGMSHGYVNLIDTTTNCESLLNQLQILNHIQLQCFREVCINNPNHLQAVQRFSYLKRFGYNLNGPIDEETMNKQIATITNWHNVTDFISAGHKRYWTLKMVEQKLLQDNFKSIQEATTTYDCTITNVGYKLEKLPYQLSVAYCKSLDLEIHILSDTDSNFYIGTSVSCDKIVYLNPTTGICILQQAYTM
jgi:hypothetical protein